MILGFKQQFVEPIVYGKKIHTIREDKNNRWKIGNQIHFATGVRTKNYSQFFQGSCNGIQNIAIFPDTREVILTERIIGRSCLLQKEIECLSRNDGFDSIKDFWDWFNKPFIGKIIHWTELRY